MTSEERKGHIKDRIKDAIDGGDIDIEWMAAVFLAELKEYLED